MTQLSAAEPAPRAGSRLGAWALVLAVVVVVWPTLTGIGFILSLSDRLPEVLGVIVAVMFVLGWLLVPAALVLSVVLAILAIRRNRRLGRVLGVIALVILALVLVSFVVLGALGFLGSGFMGSGIGA